MRGFANLGNTCGINALIQCMFQSQYIISLLEKVQGKDFTIQFQHLWQLYQSDQPGILAPHGIIHVLQKFLGNVFTSGQPVDVWEIWKRHTIRDTVLIAICLITECAMKRCLQRMFHCRHGGRMNFIGSGDSLDIG